MILKASRVMAKNLKMYDPMRAHIISATQAATHPFDAMDFLRIKPLR
tara:strand:- start:3360 stop:3500 length:141 start_codon:yes stop_codon:yes gene_type:complete